MVRSSSLKRANLYLRKHRRWPLSPYKAKWHQTLNQRQAMQNFKQSLTPPQNQQQEEEQMNPSQPNILLPLLHSFSIYNCEPTPQAYQFVIKTLAESSEFCHINSVLDHLEQDEKFDVPEYILADLIKIYADANKLYDSVKLFCRIPKFRCVPSVYSLNTLLSVLCRNTEWIKMVPHILLKSRVMNIRMEESSFLILISALCRMNKVDHAIEILNCMINDGFCVDGRIFSLILSSVCLQKDLSSVEVMGFFEEMKKLGFSFGMADYSNVIRSLIKKEKGLDALGILNKMKLDGIKPDIVCYTMVLHGVIAEEDYVKAEELFDELLVLGLVPDVYTFNVYINGLCKQNKVEAGIKMVACMEELGCKPDIITFNTLLQALCKVGELNRSRDLLKEMKFKGVTLNLRTFSIMIDGLISKGEIIEACSLFEELLDKGFCPPSSMLDETICRLCHRGLTCKALELLNKMNDKNVAPGSRVWEALVLSSGTKLDSADTSLIGLGDQISN